HQYRVPVIITEHALWQPNWMDKSALVRWQALWAAKHSAFQIAVSNALRESIVHFTNSPEKVHVIPNGVETDIFRLSENGAGRKPNQILYVGFINFNKGVDVLLHAMRKLLRHKPEARLVLVGGSTYRNTRLQEERLRGLARELSLDEHVEFAGAKTPAEVARYMSESSLLVLPSHKESFGSVLVEALACGTPVVATRCGGPEDIVSERVGLLVPKGDADALAVGIAKVLDGRRLYDAARLRAYALGNFTWEHVARRTIELYDKAIDQFQAVKLNEQPGGVTYEWERSNTHPEGWRASPSAK
ncbi:MAG: glycosyltransferase, partial [Acidobacteriota bacterium]|nr:glycosyltransferase [Acidobacteriota bacterium]